MPTTGSKEAKRADYASTRPQADGAWVAAVEPGSAGNAADYNYLAHLSTAPLYELMPPILFTAVNPSDLSLLAA